MMELIMCCLLDSLERIRLVLYIKSGGGGGGTPLFGQGQVCASEQGMVFKFLSLKHSYTISLFKVLL